MSCDAIRELLSAHLDGELDEAERRLVDGHLAACAACAAEREGLHRTIGRVKGLPRVAAPAALASLVRAALPPVPDGRAVLPSRPQVPVAPATPRGRLLRFPRVAAAVAAGLLVGVAVRVAYLGVETKTERDTVEIAQGAPPAPERDLRRAANAVPAARQATDDRESEKRKALADREAPFESLAAAKKESTRGAATPSTPPAPGADKLPALDAAPTKAGVSRQLAPGVPPPPAAVERFESTPKPVAPILPATPPPPVVAQAEMAKAPAGPREARPAEPATAATTKPQPDPAGTTIAKAKGDAPKHEAGALDLLGAADTAAEPPLVAILAVRSADPARQAALLDQLAYATPARPTSATDSGLREKAAGPAGAPETALGGGSAKARRAVAGKETDPGVLTRVYDLEPDRAARFMAALAARTDFRVSVEASDAGALAAAPVGGVLRDSLKRLEGREAKADELAKAEEKRADSARKIADGADAEPAARARTLGGGARAPTSTPPAAKPAAAAAPGAPPAVTAAPVPAVAEPAPAPPADGKAGAPRRVRIVVRLMQD